MGIQKQFISASDRMITETEIIATSKQKLHHARVSYKEAYANKTHIKEEMHIMLCWSLMMQRL